MFVAAVDGAGGDVAVPVFESDVGAYEQAGWPAVEFDDVADGWPPFVVAA